MTLEETFGLNKQPFPKAASGEALLMSLAIETILARMHFGLQRDTIVLFDAECGCGKSIVMSLFAKSLDAANYQVIHTALTTLSSFSFIAHLAAIYGLPSCRFKGEAAAALLMHLRGQPKQTVVLIDEAHLLPDDSLEDLRLLTADNFDRQSPFSLVLVGQPLLRARLAEPRHYALWQRIGVRLRLRPLSEDEVQRFVDRHLKAAGYRKKSSLFEPAAVAELFHHSRGIPRLVQNIALDGMLEAMAAKKTKVDAEAISQAIIDMEAE
jgi:type II secretory pathway predicted ATPase ExeA